MRQRRGSTLVLILWTLVLLGGISLSVTRRARSAIAVASNARAQVVARYAAEGGVTSVVRALEDSLVALSDSMQRAGFFNSLTSGAFWPPSGRLGDAHVAVAIEDVNAKLDLNYADAESIAQLLSEFGEAGAAQRTASAIRAHIGTGVTPELPDESFPIGQNTPGNPAARLLGTGARYLTSLDDLMSIPDVDGSLIAGAARYLTVDGDGTTNRASAPPPVLRAARGAFVDAPNRILIVSRAWLEGSRLTHEIQAVYAIQGDDLALVRWRERTR
ncbi:MAG TPA: hypothetical protein VJ717_05755 [Gemmatimonadaceae bacterium]|nr:hypothetical protein [Gemmatimonadaceae bacterium]